MRYPVKQEVPKQRLPLRPIGFFFPEDSRRHGRLTLHAIFPQQECPMPYASVIRYFTEESKSLACISIACGTADRSCLAFGGAADLEGHSVQRDSTFDLASLTKLFTGLLLMRLAEQGKIDPDAPAVRYAPAFSRLEGLTVRQAAWFEKTIRTPERIDQAASREEALSRLFASSVCENGPRPYSDIPAMVIKHVLEGAAGRPYMNLLRDEILRPLEMEETFCLVPEALRARCVSTDREHRIENGRYILRAGVLPGTPHDPKARVINPDGEDCPGHAGLFSTAGDMTKLCQGILSGKVISSASLRLMAENHTGHPLPGGGFSQCLGCLCYVRHPDQHFSETPAFMSDSAIGLSGFSGNHLAVDPDQGVFEFYLGSRVMNRLSVLIPRPGETLGDYGLNADGTGTVLWPDGERVVSSVGYVYLKDMHMHCVTEKVLQKMRQEAAPG